MKTIKFEDFKKEVKAQGVELEHVAFKCSACGKIQSAQDLIDAGAGKTFEEVDVFLGFSCIGRFLKSGPPDKMNNQNGCNWTLGGLLQIHKLEISYPDGKTRLCFELATPEEAQAHKRGEL